MGIELKSQTVIDRTGKTLMRVTLSEDGKERTKLLTIDQFVKVISATESDNYSDQFVRIGQTRYQMYDSAVGQRGSLAAMFVVPKGKHMVCYRKRHYIVPFPTLLFAFRANTSGALYEKRCFSLQTDTPDQDTACFSYPFGNVSSCGDICFGNIESRKIMKFSDFDLLIDDFFNSETNDDYYRDGDLNLSGLKQGSLLTRLKKEDAFPADWLKLVKEKTVGQVMDQLVRN